MEEFAAPGALEREDAGPPLVEDGIVVHGRWSNNEGEVGPGWDEVGVVVMDWTVVEVGRGRRDDC